MRVATNPGAIKHLVERGMADAISAEFDRKQGIIDGLVEENARLKAEVERLTVEADWKTPARRNKALEAEVERLRKSGAVMGGFLPDTDEANAAYEDFEKGGQS